MRFDRAIITSNVHLDQKEGMLRTREDVLHEQHKGAPMRRQKKTTQCYGPHRLRPAPIDDKENCTCECEVPVGKRPYCSTGLFCARTNDDGGQHGATEEMSMAGLALASNHLSTTRQDAGEYEKQKHSLMLRGPSSCALHIKVTLNVCTLSELMAVTCAPPHNSTTAMRKHVSQQIGRFLSLK